LHLFCLSFIYAIYKFSCKNTVIVFRSKFLTSRTKGHFRTNFTRVNFTFFFSVSIFHFFLGPLNIQSTSFHAKMATLHFCQNFTFVQILTDFFFFRKNITFVFFTVIYAIYKFSCKNTDIVFRPKFLTSQTKWHFHKNFTRVNFILFFLFSF